MSNELSRRFWQVSNGQALGTKLATDPALADLNAEETTELLKAKEDSMNNERPHVGDGIVAAPGGWTFSGEVCQNFDDHIRRSIPLYDETHRLITDVAKPFLRSGTTVYDLGCSTGTLCRRLADQFGALGIRLIGVDAEAGMCRAARERSPMDSTIEYRQEDLAHIELEPCDLVTCVYVLQFLPRLCRGPLLERIHRALRPGGALILIEKVREKEDEREALYRELHFDFKRYSGFTEDEIAAKTESLEGVLDPLSALENVELLKAAGFTRMTRLFQYLSFQGWLAVK